VTVPTRAQHDAPRALWALRDLFEATSPRAASAGAAPEPLATFVEHVLGAYARRSARSMSLWARLSHRVGTLAAWTYFGGDAPAPPEPGIDEETIICELAETGGPVLVDLPGEPPRWAVLAAVGRWPWQWGDLVAVFDTHEAAAAAVDDVAGMVAELELGAQILRRTADRDALGQLSRVLAGTQGAAHALRRMAEIVRDHMASDGAKVYVVRSTGAGPILAQLCRTDLRDMARVEVPVSDDRGLADWVVNNEDWLLIPDGAAPELTGEVPEIAVTGRHRWVHVRARPARDFVEDPLPDAEKSMLFVPMAAEGRVAGVLAVWRYTGDSYDVELDTSSLLAVAPHVASACKQVLQIARLEQEMEAVSRLADALVPTTTLRLAYESIAAEMGQLARARAAILVHHDPARPGHLYFGGSWTAKDGDRAPLEALVGGLHQDCGVDAACWEERLSEALAARVMGTSVEHLGAGALLVSPADGGGLSRVAVWLSGGRDGSRSASPFDEADHVSAAFVRYAGAMLENHVRAYASTIVGAMGAATNVDASDPLDVLQQAAKLLEGATGCDTALVYSGSPDRMTVTRVFPFTPGILGLPVGKGSLTSESIQKAKAYRVLDASDGEDGLARRLDRATLKRVLGVLQWSGCRSWICCPVVHEGRCVGAIKLITSDEGRFLGPHQEAIVQAVADRAALEIHKMSHALMLEDLNRLTNELTGKSGGELGEAMVAGLRAWIDRFVRPGCEVAVLARVPDRALIFRWTDALDEKTAESLADLSRSLGRKPASFTHGAAPGVVGALVAVPIVLPGQRRLEGHIFVQHPRRFSQEDEGALREAAREMAILLNGERLRHEWTLNAGLFRHALLGPVQGLTSAAKMLGVRAQKAGADVGDLRIRVNEESEIIRLWRENQRLYMGGTVEIRAHSQDLRPVVERCLDRYRELFDARHIKVLEEWKVTGSLRFSFDDQAVDLALSNLLDNARKYTFNNREVTVGVRVEGPLVLISVEDIGHAIPERLDDEIYQEGKRMDWSDPFRVITGQGLGLPMVRSIIEQHEGRLYHTSERDGRGTNDDTTPYRVRFTIELPHNWKGRKRHG
jgi:signal transduction histidine kinase